MRTFAKITLLLCACVAFGYVVEPMIFVHSDPAAEDQSVADAKAESARLKKLKEEAEKKRLAAQLKAQEAEKARAAEKAAAEARAAALAKKSEAKTSEDVAIVEADDSKNVAEQKEPFPIKSIRLDRFEKRSVTGSPELEKSIRYAIENQRFDGLAKLLEKETYQPVSKRKEISSK